MTIPNERSTPRVSVCMITFNHSNYVTQAIESILSQDWADLELIIGDDCSGDNTLDICADFVRRDSRVRVLASSRNLGVMPNFTRTLLACRGEYVAICEGDDYWTDPHKVSKQISILDARRGFAGAAHQSVIVSEGASVRPFKKGVSPVLGTYDLIGGRVFHTASVMFRRAVLPTFCEAPLVLGCDRLLNICISFHGSIYYSDEVMCAYRLHGAGMSSTATVAQVRLDLNCLPYLKRLMPSFPVYRYRAYIYAAIGMCRTARRYQRAYYLGLSFLCSFSNFPNNLKVIWRRMRATSGVG